jgi:N-acetylneuraminic acid mutarotase
MMVTRHDNVTVVIQGKLFCIGGQGYKSSEYFSFQNNRWQKGPELPFTLEGAKAILTKQQNQCFLLGGYRDGKESEDITLFDPIKGIEKIEGCLDIPRSLHIAVLL